MTLQCVTVWGRLFVLLTFLRCIIMLWQGGHHGEYDICKSTKLSRRQARPQFPLRRLPCRYRLPLVMIPEPS